MFTIVFVAALVLGVVLRLWLACRQIRHVARHRDVVPAQFAQSIAISAHQKAAAYTIARTRLGMVELIANAAILVVLTLLGGLQKIDDVVAILFAHSGLGMLWRELAVVVAVLVITAVLDLPFSLYRQFRLESQFGFNKMTLALFFTDLIKATAIGAVLGLPILAATLALMNRAGALWWIYAWALWVVFNLIVQIIAPTFIAPLFNKFKPLDEGPLRTRIDALLARCDFAARGVYVMDGSRRSAHGNAYFTGFGSSKRIVFFDTLVERLSGPEIEAVLAHELGHFKLRHVLQRIFGSFALSFVLLALLGWLAVQPWFYADLGVDPTLATRNAIALLLFFFVLPVFSFLISPLFSILSRKHEFEADAFAATQTDPTQLIAALVKLYEDNASTLTPDPWHSAFYDSHPSAALRVARLAAFSGSS